jgi:hypothetical protein
VWKGSLSNKNGMNSNGLADGPRRPSVGNGRGITDPQAFGKSVKVIKSSNATQKVARPPIPSPLIRSASSDLLCICCVGMKTPSYFVRVGFGEAGPCEGLIVVARTL